MAVREAASDTRHSVAFLSFSICPQRYMDELARVFMLLQILQKLLLADLDPRQVDFLGMSRVGCGVTERPINIAL